MWTQETRNQYTKEWRKRNPNKVKEHCKLWRNRHKTQDKKRKQEWYLKNKERVRCQGKIWNQNNKSKIQHRYLQKTYGITLSQYEDTFQRQNGCCAICHRPQSSLKKKLGVDHNHITGKVRGLLCYECNYGLGYFKDNADILIQGAKYINSF